MSRRAGAARRARRKADADTMKLRWEVHKAMDRHFPMVHGEKKSSYRKRVYARLRRLMAVSRTRCHVSLFSKDECKRALKLLMNDRKVPPPCSMGPHVILPCGCFAHADFLSHRCRMTTCLLDFKED